ncbi:MULTISPECIES: CBASS oligonucleotide cyclase [Anaeromyxobacter]|uniref:CBASS oligonucleotide cyclase n=1 Tax=Anaeromyxobacter TaxID=161492 RepID=UPI001F59F93F|nr:MULTISPECIES: CBASS oligonucleotide cyclase [unclassified Anaeromyxobacter]
MARAVGEAFRELQSNLGITGLQVETVSARHHAVRQAVGNHIKVLDSFLTGSYARSTMIGPMSEADIDIFVVLDASYFANNSPASLLEVARQVLLRRYPRTPRISRNGQAVTITFEDFAVDVVPGFYRNGGGFLIPDTTRSGWISTDPKRHQEIITAANKAHGGALVPLVKMVKGWNRATGSPFSGFYLEMMTQRLFENVAIADYALAMTSLFDKGRNAIKYVIPDPAGFGDDVQGLRAVSSVADAVAVFDRAHEVASQAVEANWLGYPSIAIEQWRTVFGTYFPAFG